MNKITIRSSITDAQTGILTTITGEIQYHPDMVRQELLGAIQRTIGLVIP